MYCHCPDGLTAAALARAVREGRTIVSTGPTLRADLDGQTPGTTVAAGGTYKIRAAAWARGDEPDHLDRIELWSHGRVIDAKTCADQAQHAEETFQWTPKGDWDWAAVRAVSRRGWAMTSAFYAAGPSWQAPGPVECRVTLDVSGLDARQVSQASVEIWDGVPSLVSSRKQKELPLKGNTQLNVPVSSTLVVRTPNGKSQEISLYDATGMPELIEPIIAGENREQPLLDWKTYETVLQRCAQATVAVKLR